MSNSQQKYLTLLPKCITCYLTAYFDEKKPFQRVVHFEVFNVPKKSPFLEHSLKVLICTNICYCCNKQRTHWKGHRWHQEGHQEESYLRFVTYCVTCVAKKENYNRGPQMNTPAFPQKILKFFETSPVPVRRSGQAFMVIGPRIAANHSL